MARSKKNKELAAWDRIESLGGHGVWDGDMVVVSFTNSGVKDDDLRLFEDFPRVQILNLSGTSVGDEGLAHVAKIPCLEDLIICDTNISDVGIEHFRTHRPGVKVTTHRSPKDAINPFTGKPFGIPDDA